MNKKTRKYFAIIIIIVGITILIMESTELINQGKIDYDMLIIGILNIIIGLFILDSSQKKAGN